MSTERDPHTRLAALLQGLPEAERDAGLTALHELRDAAERTEDELREIAYVASHDLTEPLRMVTSYLQLLDRRAGDALDERSREFMFYAVDGAERMKALIDDLLRYSRVGTAGLHTDAVALDELLVEVLRDLEPAIADAGAIVRADPELPVVAADRVQLGQLLQNLVSNAVKFRPEDRGNTVTVSARRSADDDGFELVVADDGIGVDPGQAERIWRVFQRLHHREEYPGNGIGLAICRRIAERHGGRIWLTGREGGGSAFHVFLPDATVEDPSAEGAA
jgi:light-regulated signal transduction histidine kinase (bacteriophytochrome)